MIQDWYIQELQKQEEISKFLLEKYLNKGKELNLIQMYYDNVIIFMPPKRWRRKKQCLHCLQRLIGVLKYYANSYYTSDWSTTYYWQCDTIRLCWFNYYKQLDIIEHKLKHVGRTVTNGIDYICTDIFNFREYTQGKQKATKEIISILKNRFGYFRSDGENSESIIFHVYDYDVEICFTKNKA